MTRYLVSYNFRPVQMAKSLFAGFLIFQPFPNSLLGQRATLVGEGERGTGAQENAIDARKIKIDAREIEIVARKNGILERENHFLESFWHSHEHQNGRNTLIMSGLS